MNYKILLSYFLLISFCSIGAQDITNTPHHSDKNDIPTDSQEEPVSYVPCGYQQKPPATTLYNQANLVSSSDYILIKKNPRNLYWLLNKVHNFYSSNDTIETENDRTMVGWVGSFPEKLNELILFLIKQNKILEQKSDIRYNSVHDKWQDNGYAKVQRLQHTPYNAQTINRFLLYGPPGNGKTTLVKKIASLSGCTFKQLNGPSIIGKYIGEGAHKIISFFNEALMESKNSHRVVIVFIDEIDAIAADVDCEMRREHRAALQQLWLLLDEHKNNPNLIFIGATNSFERLDQTFLDRFGSNTLEIDNPTYALRKEIAKFYFNNNKIQLDEKLLNSFAKYTNKLSVRCIEDMIQEISTFTIKNPNKLNEELIWNVLKKTQVKFVKNKSKKQSDKLSKISQVSQLLFNVLTIGKMGLEAYQYYMQRYALPS